MEPQESSPRCSESTIYQKIAFRNLHRFFIDFGANMPPFSLQKSTNTASKIDLGRHHFFDRFLHRFFIDFARFGRPTWRHVGHFFARNGGTLWHPPRFFVGSMFFFGFLAVPTPFSRKMSRAVLGFGRFWARFLKVSGFILEVSGDNLGLRLLLENLRLLLENLYLQLRLLLENLLFRSILRFGLYFGGFW